MTFKNDIFAILKYFGKLFIFIVFTLISQIGGIIFIIALLIKKITPSYKYFNIPFIFIVLYLITTFLFVPFLAPIFGREKIENTKNIQPTNYFTVILNRNYVRPEINRLLKNTEKANSKNDISIHYLDANFPFYNGFPLLPHLSHNDGKKIDLSLIYETDNGEISKQQKSFSGYGVSEKPLSTEPDQIKKCKSLGLYQYDFSKYVSFGQINSHLNFSEKGTKLLIDNLLQNQKLEKIFIEPHLKQRLRLNHKKIRYHGCHSVRHDDHIHIQVK